MLEKKKIYPAYVSKHNSNHQKLVIILMTQSGEVLHHLAVKNYKRY